MTGIDTNVLVRYIIQDDEEQSKAATSFIESLSDKSVGLIELIVLVELTWVLSRAYGYDKSDVIRALEQILVTECFEVELSDIAWGALRAFKEGSADFSDYCIALRNHSFGASHTVTFDKKAAKFKHFTLLL